MRTANGDTRPSLRPKLRVPKKLRGNPNNMFLARMIADSHKAQIVSIEKLGEYLNVQIVRR